MVFPFPCSCCTSPLFSHQYVLGKIWKNGKHTKMIPRFKDWPMPVLLSAIAGVSGVRVPTRRASPSRRRTGEIRRCLDIGCFLSLWWEYSGNIMRIWLEYCGNIIGILLESYGNTVDGCELLNSCTTLDESLEMGCLPSINWCRISQASTVSWEYDGRYRQQDQRWSPTNTHGETG